ncbi:MAG: CCA tRNA nucleotidyltransferase [Planctomycetaceae bacterium]
MTSSEPSIQTPRDFAVSVVHQLRNAGFEALWAGGCVRDQLLRLDPKDYDVATTATPEQVIGLFGKRRTVPVGISFGVVMVLGPVKSCGQIEVATFRADGAYVDGRRPQQVHFSSAKEDAQRRDFTINGMFYDPVQDRVLDYVGGQQDLSAGIVRAIGDPKARFTEDKLRMLRAVRFAATFQFSLDSDTAEAIRSLRTGLRQVSAERIAQELRRMLSHSTRATSLRWLIDVDLLSVIFPNVFCADSLWAYPDNFFPMLCDILRSLKQPTFEPSLAMLFHTVYSPTAASQAERTARVRSECRALKLSNAETDTVCWILVSAAACNHADQVALHVIKPILADSRRDLLLDVLTAMPQALQREPVDAVFLNEYLCRTPPDVLNPVPLIDGADLKALHVAPGPTFRELLRQVRHEQLDERLSDKAEAIERVKQLLKDSAAGQPIDPEP